MLTPAIAEAALSALPEPPAAVLPVSAFGAAPDQAAWAEFHRRHGIPVVFDAAAAVAAINGVEEAPVCVSLHATKLLGIGEGGAVLCGDDGLARRITAMTGFGFEGAERVSTLRGGNYRISEYTAAVGLAALEGLPARVARMRALAEAYREQLAGKASCLQDGAGKHWATMTLNVLLPAAEVDRTLARLDSAGIEWRRWWGLGCHRHPAFADLPRTDLTATDELARRVIGVPMHDFLTRDDVRRVTSCLP
jgi:dTDP-4-amino-4,6-dideoxygalactose transaminase